MPDSYWGAAMISSDPEFTQNCESLSLKMRGTVDKAAAKGADHCKVVGTGSLNNKLVVENGEFSLANTTSSQKMALVVHQSQKKGSSSSNSLADQDVDTMVRDALELASFSLADPHLVIASQEEAPEAPPLPFLVDDAPVLGLESLGETTKKALEVFKKQPKFGLDRFEISSNLVCYSHVPNCRGVGSY